MDAVASRWSVRRTVVAAVMLASVAVLSGCALGDKSDMEARITSAPARLDGSTVRGTLAVESRLVDLPAGGVSGLGVPSAAAGVASGAVTEAPAVSFPEDGVVFSTRAVGFVLDLSADRAVLLRPDDGEPFVLIDDVVFFGRRTGIPDDDARPWVRMSLRNLAESTGVVNPLDQNRAAADAVAVAHPALFVDLAAGMLTGSIEQVGTESVGGEATTRFDGNVDLDKALRDQRRGRYPEERLEAIEALVEALGVDGGVHPASVWLDADDGLRRFSVRLVQRPVRKVEFALTVTLEIQSAADLDLVTPTAREVLSVDSVLRFVSTVAERRDEGALP